MSAAPASDDAGRDPVAAPSLLGAAKGRTAPIFGSAVDLAMAEELAFLLSGGGEVVPRLRGEDEMMALECETLTRLVGRPGALDRMRHMLATGKPLAN